MPSSTHEISQEPLSPKTAQLVVDGVCIEIPIELLDCLRIEAAERGISLAQAYREELATRRELERITPTAAEIARLAERSGAPDYLSDEMTGERPF